MSIDDLTSEFQRLILNIPLSDSQSLESRPYLSLSESINQTENMAEFKSEYLKCVPIFDGDPNELNRYLTTCESIINNFYDLRNPNSFQNVYLLNSLVSKLSGNAKLVVNIQNVSTWTELKDALYRNFADQRDETCLNRDLVMLRQLPNEKPQFFYDKVLHILNLLCSYVDIHEQTADAKALKRNLYNSLALKTFLAGLKEPLGTTIRCMKPTTLVQALQFVTEEDNIHYFQNFSHKNQPQVLRPNTQTQMRPNFNAHTQNNQFRAPQTFPSRPIPIQPRPVNQQRFFTNSQVFKYPQQNRNVFKPNNSNVSNMTRPTPMSVSATINRQPSTMNTQPSAMNRQPSTMNRQPQQQRLNYTPNQYNSYFTQNPSTSRNFVSEELFNTDVDELNPISTEPNTQHDENFENNFQNDQELEYSDHYPDQSDENFMNLPRDNDQT